MGCGMCYWDVVWYVDGLDYFVVGVVLDGGVVG